MKKSLAIFLAFIMVIINNIPVYATETLYPVIESEAAVLMDSKTGQVLFEKNMHEQLYPASITKIMTVLLGVENGELDEIVTMSHQAVFSIELGASHIALDVGEQITLEQALMAAMLPSANEACNGIAEHVSGNIPKFVELMNKRAAEAGALHTNFSNTNGLCKEDHLTTAYDMAMITKAALMNDQFRRIFGTAKYEIPPTNKQTETRYLWAEHKMFACGRYEYDGVIGGKTGYTENSKNTLVTVAKRGERELIAVVIKSQNAAVYTDTKALFDYGFDQFKEAEIMLPAITEDNLTNPSDNDNIKALQKNFTNLQDSKYTRLLHKNINVNDIVIDYTAIKNSPENILQLQMNMNLENNSELMYKNIGSILLEIPINSNNLLRNNLLPDNFLHIVLNKCLFILHIIIKIVVGFFLFILALRWLLKITNMRDKLSKRITRKKRLSRQLGIINQSTLSEKDQKTRHEDYY